MCALQRILRVPSTRHDVGLAKIVRVSKHGTRGPRGGGGGGGGGGRRRPKHLTTMRPAQQCEAENRRRWTTTKASHPRTGRTSQEHGTSGPRAGEHSRAGRRPAAPPC